ncbi:PAS domain S-box protein [Paenibacillus xylanivorans]|uniref:PAS domain S-box protein n=1 Tax=Paenibacillus xylanivorans TaxID=1705561 RepID=UPI000A83B2A4
MDIQLDVAPCGYFSIADSGIIQSINQTLLTLLGYERNELLGRHIEATMSVTNKLFFHTYFYPYIQLYGHVDEMYFSFRTSDQQDVPVLLNGVRQTRNGESVIDCVVVVMRKRIEHEKDILNTKTKLQELYQATHEANKERDTVHRWPLPIGVSITLQ